MTSQEDPLPPGGQLRDEAADWFATMRGPEAGARREEFEAWLARGALHRSAYNRIAETFSIGKGLRAGDPPGDGEPEAIPNEATKDRRRILIAFVATATIAGVLSLSITQRHEHSADSMAVGRQPVVARSAPTQLSTRVGEIRTFALQDGSSVTLDTDSLLAVAFTGQERGLRLIRGRGRFSVAHAAQPFVVRAGGGSVTARGTLFDVGLTSDDKVHVHLLRGVVEVVVPTPARSGSPATRVKRLVPGEEISFGPPSLPEQAAPAAAADADNWPQNVRDFDHIRLADLVVEANRYSTMPIILSTTDLADLRISGTFRLTDTHTLADNLAVMLRLSVTQTADSITLARSCGADTTKNCRTSS
ncbi:hypothetical protein AWL63_24270 (plasmid) [Sphingomonas panacis]|uniref:FecR protein domain-containing protein n=1 Tax=Sphingomonas panacis TaxID=1560345 RepID=A0A1B3ZIL8_9SPHN|nr:FecR domain-containing protein [Sphingomonas panacis]AOH87269.1 hypothetical protein AWL63_24270 [Sphingomonas panacis]